PNQQHSARKVSPPMRCLASSTRASSVAVEKRRLASRPSVRFGWRTPLSNSRAHRARTLERTQTSASLLRGAVGAYSKHREHVRPHLQGCTFALDPSAPRLVRPPSTLLRRAREACARNRRSATRGAHAVPSTPRRSPPLTWRGVHSSWRRLE